MDAREHLIEFEGERHCIAEWAKLRSVELCGLSKGGLYARLYGGWTVQEAFTLPKGASRFQRPYRNGNPDGLSRKEKRLAGQLFVGWCKKCGLGHMIWSPGKPPQCNSCNEVF